MGFLGVSPAASCTGPRTGQSTRASGLKLAHQGLLLPDSAAMSSPPRYLINFLLDATVGMLLIYVGVRAVSVLVEWQQWESLRFGEYGNVAWTLVT